MLEVARLSAISAGTKAASEGIRAWADTQDADDQQGEKAGAAHAVRRVVAFLIVAACVTGFFATRVVDGWALCTKQTTTRSGIEAVVETCKPLAVQDVVPALLLAVVLMWPDIASFELTGIGKIQRRVDDQAARQDGLEAQQQLLMQTVVSSTASANNAMHLTLANPDIAGLISRFSELEARLDGVDQNGPPGGSGDEVQPAEDSPPADASTPRAAEQAPAIRVLSPGQQLREVTKDLHPWLDYVLKLRSEQFYGVAQSWAGGDDTALEALPKRERHILQRTEAVAGKRPDPSTAVRWSQQNQSYLSLLRQALERGDGLDADTANSAAQVADTLRRHLGAMKLV